MLTTRPDQPGAGVRIGGFAVVGAVLAASSGERAAEGLLPVALFVFALMVLFWLFERVVGGDGGGSEKESVGAWWLLAAVVVGVMVAARA